MKNAHFQIFRDFKSYLRLIGRYTFKHSYKLFSKFEGLKDFIAVNLYRQRGRLARPFIHTGMMMLIALAIMLAPVLAQEPVRSEEPEYKLFSPFEDDLTETTVSDKPRDRIIHYTIETGDTVASIAKKFDVSIDTIRWQNKLDRIDQIKPGQTLEILPVTGIQHKVQKGDTIHSISKKYGLESAQAIVDFPFNSFTNDETFALAVGQTIIVPDGVQPAVKLWSPNTFVAKKTPDAGAVTASGAFVWPAGGTITQKFAWYHKGVDIANRAAPGIVAADSGRVIVAGWPDSSGYGNRVIIDHENGYQTLYAHLSKVYVTSGQRVKRGDLVGQMGSTGRSTGTHLHFEIRSNKGNLNPLGFLK
jgi:murein DD-endopeptidase MepM/ murein hydrolase activator NlpD